jgi:ADP-heptose:LPS heptosyltransferase
LRKLRIDTAVDFEFFARSSAILTYLSAADVRVGLHSFSGEASYRGDLMTHRLSYNPFLHAAETFAVMVEAINAPPDSLPTLNMEIPTCGESDPVFTPSEQELQEVKQIVTEAAHTEDFSSLILLNANTSDLLPIRRWPNQRYVELAQRLFQAAPDILVAFTGAPSEAEQANKLVEEVGSNRCFSLAGKTTLRQLMVLYCLSDLLVTNDSGPAHFATMTPIQVVTLFGPENPAVFGARTPNAHVLHKHLPCSPCVSAFNDRNSACRNNVCMQRISVDEVFELSSRLCKLPEQSGIPAAPTHEARSNVQAIPRTTTPTTDTTRFSGSGV